MTMMIMMEDADYGSAEMGVLWYWWWWLNFDIYATGYDKDSDVVSQMMMMIWQN